MQKAQVMQEVYSLIGEHCRQEIVRLALSNFLFTICKLMKKTKVTIINKLGLHARASAKFVSTAARFQSQIEVTKGSQTINGKSIMGVMMLAASQGCELILEIDGPDEVEMEEALKNLIHNRFYESE